MIILMTKMMVLMTMNKGMLMKMMMMMTMLIVLITEAMLNMLMIFMTMLMTYLMLMIILPMMPPSRVSQQSGKEKSGQTVMEAEKESFKTAAMSEKKTVPDR